MKLLLLLIPLLIFSTSCEDVEGLSSTSPFSKFLNVKDLLFTYSERSENKYLVIDETDSVGKQFEVLTYREDASGNRTNEVVTVYNCDAEDCRTETIGETYKKIELLEESTKIIIGIYRKPNDQLSSSSRYDLIED